VVWSRAQGLCKRLYAHQCTPTWPPLCEMKITFTN
jgi:hypothetical protein